jgi:hypothetical protein
MHTLSKAGEWRLISMYTSRDVPMMMSRSHLEKSGSCREWNRPGRSSPKNTISGFTKPWRERGGGGNNNYGQLHVYVAMQFYN